MKTNYEPVRKMKTVLEPDTLYVGDNGRIFHGKCAGVSASYTGRDISGQKVEKLSAAEQAYAKAQYGIDLGCESCASRVRS